MRTFSLIAVLPLAALAAPTALVGVLTEQADRLCTAQGDDWVNKHFQVGYVELVGEVPDAKALLGKPVIVTGAVVPRPAHPVVKHTAECQVMQMRSDWEVSYNGMRVRRTEPSGVDGFRVDAIKPLEGLTGAKEGEEVVVTFTNKTKAPLSEVVIELHYEGCYGKPGRGTERRRAPTLKPNSTAKARGPLILTKHARHKDRAHALRAVNVVAKGSHVVFDLSVDALELGVAVECPRRDPRRK